MGIVAPNGEATKWRVAVTYDRTTGQLAINRDDDTTPVEAYWLLQRASLIVLQAPPDASPIQLPPNGAAIPPPQGDGS